MLCEVINSDKMSNHDPPRESLSAVAPNNDTIITIVSNTTPPVASQPASATEPSNDELNSSIGSQRSLNSRLFPFRFSRDILLNNVSLLNTCETLCSMIHPYYDFACLFRFFKKFDLWCKTRAPLTLHLLLGCAALSIVFKVTNTRRKQTALDQTSKQEQITSLSTLVRHPRLHTLGKTQHQLALPLTQQTMKWAAPVQTNREFHSHNTKALILPDRMQQKTTQIRLKMAVIHSHKFLKPELSLTPSLAIFHMSVYFSQKAAMITSMEYWISSHCLSSSHTQTSL